MKAVYNNEFGGPENLQIREIADPSAPAGCNVLVQVKAAGLNRADLLQRRGLYPAPAGYSTNIPGLEFAGVVAEIGDSVTNVKIGDRVFGITAGEAQAEYLISHESLLIPIPENLDFIKAAAIPEAFITAHDAIFTRGQIHPGESLLIHAVGSGVGLAGFQLAKASGCLVIGTSRTSEKLTRCRDFGLDHGIEVTNDPRFSEKVSEITSGKGADVVLDLVGAAYFKENIASLAVKGRLVLVGLTSGASTEFDMRAALQKRLTIVGTVLRGRAVEDKAEATRAFAEFALPLFENGNLKPNVDKVFSAADVRAAHEYLESNESFGKVVLDFQGV